MNSDDPETCTADIEQTWKITLQHLMSFFVGFLTCWKISTTQSYIKNKKKLLTYISMQITHILINFILICNIYSIFFSFENILEVFFKYILYILKFTMETRLLVIINPVYFFKEKKNKKQRGRKHWSTESQAGSFLTRKVLLMISSLMWLNLVWLQKSKESVKLPTHDAYNIMFTRTKHLVIQPSWHIT